eukprot:6606780-Pyramimonas_sp.AAC.1
MSARMESGGPSSASRKAGPHACRPPTQSATKPSGWSCARTTNMHGPTSARAMAAPSRTPWGPPA